MQCTNCGSGEFDILTNGSGRCRYCGTIIPNMAQPAPNVFERQFNNVGTSFETGSKNRIVALLITFFFGYVGAQYFYYGNYLAGVLSLLFFWTFIPTIIAIVHFFVLLGMSDDQFNMKYNRRK